jgi:hypothetical protein
MQTESESESKIPGKLTRLGRPGAIKRKGIKTISNNSNSGVGVSNTNSNSIERSLSSQNISSVEPPLRQLSRKLSRELSRESRDTDLSTNNIISDDEKLYFVLIRAHGGLPYIPNNDTSKRVKTITVPSHMNVHKITSVVNGATNCGAYNYGDKKSDIKNKIAKYITETTQDKQMQQTIAEKIQKLLRKKEKKIEEFKNTFIQRTSISTGTFINKEFEKYGEERKNNNITNTVELMFFIPSTETNTIETMSADIFDAIKNNDNKTFDLQSIISWLATNHMKNIIILDFSCSSFYNPNSLTNHEIIDYLNEQDLHGGMYKEKYKKIKKLNKTKKLKTKKLKTKYNNK